MLWSNVLGTSVTVDRYNNHDCTDQVQIDTFPEITGVCDFDFLGATFIGGGCVIARNDVVRPGDIASSPKKRAGPKQATTAAATSLRI